MQDKRKSEDQNISIAEIKKNVFRSFTDDEFISYQSWQELEEILDSSNGGAYGISGPRGAGKTWLISKSVAWAREKDGVGLWFPTPSDYGAEPFLTALADNFASEVQRKFPKGKPQWYARFSSNWILGVSAVLFFALLIGYFSYLGEGIRYPYEFLKFLNPATAISANEGFLLEELIQQDSLQDVIGSSPVMTQRQYTTDVILKILQLVGIYGSGFFFAAALIGIMAKTKTSIHLYMEAIKLKQRLRYTETLRRSLASGISVGPETKKLGINLESERNLAERALTIASLVYEFRDFLHQVATRTQGPIVIGIDELDKIHDPGKAKELLRDIKGIFEIDGVHFLVSVSDEAKKTLQLGSLQERDEFNSSFYTVVDILPHTPKECASLLEKRSPDSFEKSALLALGILGGGNLRETLRLAASCLTSSLNNDVSITLPQALSTVLNTEARTIREEIISTDLPEPIKVEAYQSLEPDQFSFEKIGNAKEPVRDLPKMILEQKSEDADISPGNLNLLIDIWSKFHVRYTIAKYILQNPEALENIEFTIDLQEVAALIEHSAAVGQHCFEKLVSNTNTGK